MDQKQPRKAYEIYQQILRDDPGNPFVYVSLSNYYKLNRQDDKALEQRTAKAGRLYRQAWFYPFARNFVSAHQQSEPLEDLGIKVHLMT